jgi:hypothetical protein
MVALLKDLNRDHHRFEIPEVRTKNPEVPICK